MSTDDLVAQFLAKGGQVKNCEQGATALDMSPRQWAKAIREPGTVQSRHRQTYNDREAAWHEAHDAFFVGDHGEGYRILDERE
jgi:hypothetical protein